MAFREFHLIQHKHDGSFLREDLSYTHLAKRAGRIYDVHEALDTAKANLGEDYVIFTAFEKVEDFH